MVKILLVEDDLLDAIDIERTLKKTKIPYLLTTASNGLDALALLRESSKASLPDLILLDINMPKMNGLEFLKELRSDEALKRITVFVLTTSSQPADEENFRALRISGFITKPLSLTDFNRSKDSLPLFIDLLNTSKLNSRI